MVFTVTCILKRVLPGVPVVAQRKPIRLVSMRMWVRSLDSLSGSGIWRCCELWYGPAAAAPIRPLAWELPYAKDVALKSKTNKQTKAVSGHSVLTLDIYLLMFLSSL